MKLLYKRPQAAPGLSAPRLRPTAKVESTQQLIERFYIKTAAMIACMFLFIPQAVFGSGFDNAIQDTISANIQDAIVRNISDNKGNSIAATIHKTTLKVSNMVGSIVQLNSCCNDKIIALRFKAGDIRFWDLQEGTQWSMPASNISMNDMVIPLAGGLKALLVQKSGNLILKDILIKNSSRELGNFQEQVYVIASPDGSMILCAGKDRIVRLIKLDIKAPNRGLTIARSQVADVHKIPLSPKRQVVSIGFSPDSRFFSIGDQSGIITVHNCLDNTVLHKFSMGNSAIFSKLFTTPKGNIYLAGVTENGLIHVWDLETASPKRWQKNTKMTSVKVFGVGREGTHLAAGDKNGKIVIFNAVTGEQTGTLKLNKKKVHFVTPVARGRMVLTICDNGEICIYDIESKNLILRGISTKSGWVVIDSQGRFDGTEDALADVGWLVSDFNLNLDNFSKVYYEPGLLTKYINTDIPFISNGLFDVSKGIALPPAIHKLSFLQPSRNANQPNQVIIAAKSIGSRIEDIELFHNGKRVPQSSIIADKTNHENANITVRAVAYQVNPVPGENRFRAVGTGLGNIEGPSKTLSETFHGSIKESVLHVVAVGIDQYKLPSLNLSYAKADASAIAASFKAHSGLFSDIKITRLFDHDATVSNLKKILNSATQATKQTDTLVIYLAGHGLVSGEEWLYMSHDLKGTCADDFLKAGLSNSQLHQILVSAPAQKIFILIDSCHSGQAVSLYEKFLVSRLHRSLGRSAGISIFAASRADQSAHESNELGHGIFTFSILSGLQGDADIYNPDNKISARELLDYSKNLVPTYSQNYLNEPQIPVAFTKGSDFYVGKY